MYLHMEGVVYLHMSDEKPYSDRYLDEFRRLNEAQDKAASTFAAHTLYLREEQAGRLIPGTRPEVRRRLADEAATEWLRLAEEIRALNHAEYLKKEAAERAAG